MIINDLQRLRWQILDEALRDPIMEYFMAERTKTNETGNTRSLIHHVNSRLREMNRDYSCSKRMLQNDLNYFKEKGARLEPSFRRGHKRILRYINPEWKNPLLKPAKSLYPLPDTPSTSLPLPEGIMTPVTLKLTGSEEEVMGRLQSPQVLSRLADTRSGTVTCQVELPMSEALPLTLMGFGTKVEVLAPESLRREMAKEISTLAKMYKKEAVKKEAVQQELFGDLF